MALRVTDDVSGGVGVPLRLALPVPVTDDEAVRDPVGERVDVPVLLGVPLAVRETVGVCVADCVPDAEPVWLGAMLLLGVPVGLA